MTYYGYLRALAWPHWVDQGILRKCITRGADRAVGLTHRISTAVSFNQVVNIERYLDTNAERLGITS